MNENAMTPLSLTTIFVIVALSGAARLPSASTAELPKPNVIVVLADDLGYGDVKCFGGDRCQVDTPHFDRLAREGMRFTDVHSISILPLLHETEPVRPRRSMIFQATRAMAIRSGDWKLLFCPGAGCDDRWLIPDGHETAETIPNAKATTS